MKKDEKQPTPAPVQPSAGEIKDMVKRLVANEEKLFLTADVMNFLSISRATVYRWTKKNLLPGAKISGTYYYSSTVLCDFIVRKMHSGMLPPPKESEVAEA